MKNKKGRNKILIRRRNDMLLAMYYHLSEIRRLRYDAVLDILSEEEFFLSKNRIDDIIKEEGGRAKSCWDAEQISLKRKRPNIFRD